MGNSAGAGLWSHQRVAGWGNSVTGGHRVTTRGKNKAQSSPWGTVVNGSQHESLALWLSKSLNQCLLPVFKKQKLATAHFQLVTTLLIKIPGSFSFAHFHFLLSD